MSLHRGQFGLLCLCDADVFQQRIVQIGWSVGTIGEQEPEEREEYVVLPQSFQIAAKATAKHGITNERAQREGLPLREVLEKFMQAMVRLDERNGRVVSHHLECRGRTHMKYTGVVPHVPQPKKCSAGSTPASSARSWRPPAWRRRTKSGPPSPRKASEPWTIRA